MPEFIYATIKIYLLRLEGVFRSFAGEVLRNDDALCGAIQEVYGRLGPDMNQILSKLRDNAIFNFGSVKAKGDGKGKGKAMATQVKR